jgi:Arc/MetJ-type ribon-helix-helix transcriptional regulator
MRDGETMKIDLDPEAQRFIEEKVKAGAYPSAADAVNGLLAQAKLQEEWTADDVAELRALVAVAAEQSARVNPNPGMLATSSGDCVST